MIKDLRLICLLIFLGVFIKLHTSSAEDEMQFIYHGFHEGEAANLHLDGLAEILPNGLLQLTNTSKQQSGHAFHPFPMKFSMSSLNVTQPYSFSTSFVFAIVPEWANGSGHGIAFAISPSMDFSQAMAIEYFGLFNLSNNGVSSNHVFAVELDTIKTLNFYDVDNNHVGIDINSLVSNASAPASYFSNTEGKNKSLELISGDPIQVWIEYDWNKKLLTVALAPIGVQKPIRPLLSFPLDLSLVLLDNMYVGFSSATGSIASNHYILGWSFNRSGEAQSFEYSKLPSLPRSAKQRKKLWLQIWLPIIGVTGLMGVLGMIYIVRKIRYKELREDWEQEYGPQRFCYKDLYKATKGFKDRELIGVGGFGKVYKGVLPCTGAQIAVKKISHESSQGMREFVAEIASMGRLKHRNLVQLLGYCRRKGELLLVYDYMPYGSLDKVLFSNEQPNLSWDQRCRIIRGIASGLLYLHEQSEQVVLHRDIKASNILLDADLNGRLGDFGMARFYDHGAIPETTDVVGTVGYLAPELTRTGKATTSSDVFAFGAFLLEMACGRRPIEPERLPKEVILLEWVFENWKLGEILQTSDPRLEGSFLQEEMELVLKLGLLCSHTNPAARPCMRQVVQYLDGNAILPEVLLEDADIGIVAMSSQQSEKLNLPFPSSFISVQGIFSDS
ncbi:hypothetical protein ACH5RR_010114 [Cinchona calisaya]|uniref:non-specific serine/threonine protein kinase n=1 Tax=Cinchona calisaya TaxID=153742 RepID=A0ABD3AIA6_9GENT